MVKKTTYCSECGKNCFAELEEINKKLEEMKKKTKKREEKLNRIRQENSEIEQINKKLKEILNSRKKPWETKLALFNLVKNLKTEEPPLENKRENYLLESQLLNYLAKESMKKYRKVTTQSFSEEK